jgi:hypothetical protein
VNNTTVLLADIDDTDSDDTGSLTDDGTVSSLLLF